MLSPIGGSFKSISGRKLVGDSDGGSDRALFGKHGGSKHGGSARTTSRWHFDFMGEVSTQLKVMDVTANIVVEVSTRERNVLKGGAVTERAVGIVLIPLSRLLSGSFDAAGNRGQQWAGSNGDGSGDSSRSSSPIFSIHKLFR
jgi:hypothetical protein